MSDGVSMCVEINSSSHILHIEPQASNAVVVSVLDPYVERGKS